MKAFQLVWVTLWAAMAGLSAQSTFQKSLPAHLVAPLVRSTPDGQDVYVAGAEKANGQVRLHVFKIDASGALLWHRRHVSNLLSLDIRSIAALSDGVVVGLSDDRNDTRADCFLFKLDNGGNLAWSRRIGAANRTQLIEIEKDGLEDIWLSGLQMPASFTDSAFYYLMKIDPADGHIKAAKQCRHSYFQEDTGDEYFSATHLTWSRAANTFVMVEDFDVPYATSAIIEPSRRSYSLGYADLDLETDELLWNFEFEGLMASKNHLAVGGFNGAAFQPPYSFDPAIALLNASGKSVLHTKATPTLLQPLHGNNSDIVFYSPAEKTLVKYDTLLEPIWAKKFDNCAETTAFNGDVAADGSIYTARNIDAKTILSRIAPDGALPDCVSYDEPAPPADFFPNDEGTSYGPSGNYPFAWFSQDSAFVFLAQNTSLSDFCVRLDADFGVPDTVCLGTTLLPTEVDSSAGLLHSWWFGSVATNDQSPEITFAAPGLHPILHRVENNICLDTLTRFVRALPVPLLAVGDTVVCGFPALNLDFQSADATAYFLDGMPVAPQISLNQSGIYQIRLENGPCSAETTFSLKVVDFPWPVTLPDSTYCAGEPLAFALGADFDQIFWDNAPVADTFFIRDGQLHAYRASYIPDRDCVVSGALRVPRKDCDREPPFYVPNSFSPNGDSANRLFRAYAVPDVQLLGMQVFDRWGNLLFDSDDPENEGWDGDSDGQKCAPGVYAYVVRYRDLNADALRVLSGSVTLFR
jgi:gliding motility-associated-like protein